MATPRAGMGSGADRAPSISSMSGSHAMTRSRLNGIRGIADHRRRGGLQQEALPVLDQCSAGCR